MRSKSEPTARRKPGSTPADGGLNAAQQHDYAANVDYRLLVDEAQYGIFVIGEDRRILMANRAAAVMLGHERCDLNGKDVLEFVHPDWWKAGTPLFRPRSVAAEPSDIVELMMLTGSGASLWVDISSTAIPWRERDAVMVTTRDITRRKQIEQALRDSERTMRSVIDVVPHPLFAKDADGRFLLVNQAAARFLGTTVEALLGRKDSDFVPYAQAMERIRQDDLEVINSGQPKFVAEQSARDAQGVTHIVQTSKVPITFPGHAQPAVLGVAVDITERKAIEHQLQEREGAFRAIAETAEEGIIVVDAHRRVLYSNPKAQSLLGVGPEGLSNGDVLEFFVPEERDAVVIRHRELLSRQRLPQRGTQTFVNSRGQPVKVEIISAVTTWHGQQALLSMFHDITNRLRMEEELRHHRENLEYLLAQRTDHIRRMERRQANIEKLAAISDLAGRIAHEINNPLAGVKNAFLLIKSEIREDAPCAKYVRMVDKEIDRMSRIVGELYSLYRPGLRPAAEFRVADTLAEVTALLGEECQSRRVRLQAQVRPTGATFFGNEDTVRQVLFNLAKNALEASPPGAVVTVEAVAGEDALHLSVTDEGVGIPDDVREQIFEPFFTTKLSRDSAGLGLGLAVCKNLIEAAKGSLKFESVVGQCTVFRVHLPSCRPSDL